MAPSYTCPRCTYTTSRLSSFKTHLSNTNVCEVTNEDVPIDQLREKYGIPYEKTIHNCLYCKKKYSNHSALFYHNLKCKPRPVTVESLREIIKQKDLVINGLLEKVEQYKEWISKAPL